MKLKKYIWFTNIITFAAVAGLLAFGSTSLYVLVYVTIFLILIIRTLITQGPKRVKFGLFMAYGLILSCQIVLMVGLFVREDEVDPSLTVYWTRRIVCTLVIAVPLVISRYIMVAKYAQFYLPSIKEAGSIGFAELKNVAANATMFAEKAGRTRRSLSPENLREVLSYIPRHSAFNYINNGTLEDEYFTQAEKTLDDLNLYIIISHTGSAASDVISVFTNKNYNHTSLSFDRDLNTIVSYNGGNNVYPPGMNPEMLADFAKKDNSSILVYSLPCTKEQKSQILERIREINESGSAFNALGLFTKRSYRPNIMFCSQFVYRMLEFAELSYFSKPDGYVQPTDFIELDYKRKLKYEYEVEL
jgi:hypothetical protein